MGGVISCCVTGANSETDSLVQNAQKGYGSYGNEDYDAIKRKLEEEEQKILAREQELTEIVNNTNDKLIDISMMSNSGIVIQSHDLCDATSDDTAGGPLSTSEPPCLSRVGTKELSDSQRKAVRRLYTRFFEHLETQLSLENSTELIVNL
ncbi:LADA_0G11518g1_1 [Lachancea dasiensis]|uniref:LADA_0G11518g1_1 n=1 Tax=Lachancea dasiensis TaxID=1072105 RepID=A0A1G4JV02_9SACH|nr:LADA_0G11518g1_1 [Lachancea dasiensis]